MLLKPRVAITLGDPRGIGPEVVLKALARPDLRELCTPLILGDPGVLGRTAAEVGIRLPLEEVEDAGDAPPAAVAVLPLSRLPRQISPEQGARASFAYVRRAAELALAGEVQAMATAPVSKEGIAAAGIPFRGHTEFLAEFSATKEFVMMLAGERLRVALVTTHLPLRAVAPLLTEEKICAVVEITAAGLRDFFGLPAPRIAVAALNPHAGEGGLFGDEEGIIAAAVRRAGTSLAVSGPWPADTLFFRASQGEFDAVVCMYHDQGLIPLKLLHFHAAVNITLGLPFIRTSADHGVAYDIAGQGRADSRSMEEAIRLAARLARRKMGGIVRTA